MTHETRSAGELRILGSSVIAIDDARELAVGSQLREIPGHVARKAGVAIARGPCQRPVSGEIKGNAQPRVNVMGKFELGGVRNGVVDRTVGDTIQEGLCAGA